VEQEITERDEDGVGRDVDTDSRPVNSMERVPGVGLKLAFSSTRDLFSKRLVCHTYILTILTLMIS
jgi:hypothetical protein